MPTLTYIQLLNKTLQLYLQEDYLEAYHFITKNAKKVRGNQAQIYNFRYSTACKAGLEDLALEILREAVLEKGLWYAYDYLVNDDDLKPLHGKDDFDSIANLCRERENEAQNNSYPDLRVITPSTSSKDKDYPLLIALHGDQENIDLTEGYWVSCVKKGRLLALPQSSRIEFPDAYRWEDIEEGARELKGHFDKIAAEFKIDMNDIIVGGFSSGARVALYAILQHIIQVKGFIFVGPWLPEIEEWEHMLTGIEPDKLRGYVICGDKDEDCLEGFEKLIALLDKWEIPHISRTMSGLEHDYPADFAGELEEAIAYLDRTRP